MYEKLKRDGDWLLVFKHDVVNGGVFASHEEARFIGNSSEDPKFSVLRDIERFRRQDGKFQFKLVYPERDYTAIWKQSNQFASDITNQVLRNGIFAGGQGVEENINKKGTWNIVQKPNAGSSSYVLERPYSGITTEQYVIAVPQSRLKTNTTYTLTCWVAYENDIDQENAHIFHARYWDGNDMEHTIIPTAGSVYTSAGNDITIDGVRWVRRFYQFTTPNSLTNSRSLQWYVGYNPQTANIPTGDAWYTNFQIYSGNLNSNYIGDYIPPYSSGVKGFESIQTISPFAGLERGIERYALGDGSLGINDWWWAIGAKETLGETDRIPGPRNVESVSYVELWIYDPVSTRVGNQTLETKHLTESSYISNRLDINGIASSGTPYCYLNGTNIIASVTPRDYNMVLIILNQDSSVALNTTYDLSSTTQRNNFLNAISTVTDNQLAVFVSVGKVFAHPDLDSAMDALHSVEWRGVDYYSQYDYSFFGVAKGDIGFVSERTIFDHPLDNDNNNAISISYDDTTDIGITGYGKPIFELYGNSGGYSIDGVGVPIENYVDGQYVLFEVIAKRSLSDTVNNTTRWASLYFKDGAGANLTSGGKIQVLSCGMYQKYTEYVQIPVGSAYLDFWGDSDIKSVAVYKAGMKIPREDTVRINEHGIASSRYVQSPLSTSFYNSDEFVRFARSDSNLLAGKPFESSEVVNVHFGNHLLSSINERLYISTSENVLVYTSKANVDPSRIYYCGVWVYVHEKTRGRIYLGNEAYDSSGNEVPVYRITGGSHWSGNFRADGSFNVSQSSVGKWILLDGWMLPYDWTVQQMIDFSNKYHNFFGVHDETGMNDLANGIGVVNGWTDPETSVFRFDRDTSTFALRCIDYYNKGNQSDTLWAFPFIADMTAAAWDTHNVYSPELVQIDQIN